MENFKFTTIDRVFAKLGRDMRGTDLHETDIIEYIGECMDEFKISGIVEQSVCFSEVKNFEAEIPDHLSLVLQIARYNGDTPCVLPTETIKSVTEESVNTESTEDETCYSGTPVDCEGNPIFDDYEPSYIPNFDMQWQYTPWITSDFYQNNFSPVRLANSTFFNTMVCKEVNQQVYQSCENEYTIVQGIDRKFRFSFQEGYVAVSYTRTRLDPKTGYPLVPDDNSFINAIVYYIKWKIAEREWWRGRQGAQSLSQDNERKWIKYCGQAKSKAKMPQTLDDYQDLLESSHQMIPDHRRYYGFFGKLGREENKKYLDPDGRNKMSRYFLR